MTPSDNEAVLFRAEIKQPEIIRAWALYFAVPFCLPLIFVIVLACLTTPLYLLLALAPLLMLAGDIIVLGNNGISGIELQKGKMLYRTPRKEEWKTLELESLHHACYNMGIRRGDSLPIARLFDKDSKPIKDLKLWLNEKDTYRFLSVLHRMGYTVAIFGIDENIEDTMYYWPGSDYI